MIRHIFKLSWNKKRKHLLLVIELFFAYLVTSFLIFFLFVTAFFQDDPQFNTDNLIEISDVRSRDTLMQNTLAISAVRSVSLTDFRPYYTMATNNTIQYQNNALRVYKWGADENLQSTIGLSMESGRWFITQDRSSGTRPLIINSTLKQQLFAGKTAEGMSVKVDSNEFKIVGVVKDLNDPSAVYKNRPHVFVLDTGEVLLVKLKKTMDNAVYAKLRAAVPGVRREFGSDNIHPVEQSKKKRTSRSDSLTMVMAVLSGFLIINVILGLFSMLYQNINRRKAEIGVRRAAGATASQIYSQIIGETLVMATIAIIPGAIIAYQFALFGVFGDSPYYYYAMVIGASIIYLLVILCALYPAMLASKIQPAEALHEE